MRKPPKIPGVLKLTVNDHDQPNDPDKWTVDKVEKLAEIPPDAHFVVCRRFTVPLFFPDNQLGKCAGCGAAIQFRPNNTIPVKICDGCAEPWLVAHANRS